MMIPAHGRPADDLIAELTERAAGDTKWREGRVFSLVYKIPGELGAAHDDLLRRAHELYGSTNLLNPMAFKSLKQMETDLVEMTGRLFHCAGAVGTVTSGGTESILCAVAAYRDRARRERPWIRRPELIVPITVHPAFDKAAHYFGVKLVKIAVGDDLRVDVHAVARKIGRRTIGIVGSAPQYPHGVIDPIAELGALAQRHGIPLHVDACVGGFMLPWLEKLGRPVPRWDFRVPGVTSISADLHKFGYAAKGASVLLWRSIDQMRHQFFVATDFPGGIYASPTLLGTRPGGPIAAAWTALQALGEDGYLRLATLAADAADRFRAGIAAIPGLELVGQGDATIVAYRATSPVPTAGVATASARVGALVDALRGDGPIAARLVEALRGGGPALDIYAVADRLEARGWTIDRQHRPASLHLTVTANHASVVDDYLADLRAAVDEVRANPALARSGSAPMYGMAGRMPARVLVKQQVRKVFADMYSRGGPS